MDLVIFMRVKGDARREILWAMGLWKRKTVEQIPMVDDDMAQALNNKNDYSRKCYQDGIPCKSFECWQKKKFPSVVCKMDCECFRCVYGACPPALNNKE